MRIYLDLDSRRLLTTPTRPLTSLEFKRRDNDSIELQFLRDAVVQELPAGTTARVGIKPSGDYDAAFLAVATLTQSGTGTATFYSGELNLHTTAMATAFEDEPVTISAMLEVEWVTGDVVSSSKTLPTTIQNDVIRGDEGEPAELPIFYTTATSDFRATQAQAEAGADNAVWMTPLRTAQAIAELAPPPTWSSVLDKPATFAPTPHTHAIADTTGLQDALDGKAASTHSHSIANVTGLQTALDGKAANTHTHSLADISDSGAFFGQVATWDGTAWVPQTPSSSGGVTSYNDLTDVPSTFSPSTHSHAASDITSGTLVLARIPTGTTSSTVALGNHTHTLSQISASGATNGQVATWNGSAWVPASAGSSSSDITVNGIRVGRGGNNNDRNTVVGSGALNAFQSSSGTDNTAIGLAALETVMNYGGSRNTAVGSLSLKNCRGSENTAIGRDSLFLNVAGSGNSGLGASSLINNSGGSNNTALGFQSLSSLYELSNCSGVGHDSQVTASNQVQLGNSATSTFAFGAVQNRSDARDKKDVKDTELGLDFIKALRPVDFKWDFREDYRTQGNHDLSTITTDGSKKRNRFHHGLIAQEVKAVLEAQGIDFGGFQDHSISGGQDVMSIGYTELIAPLIKAVQELSSELAIVKQELVELKK